MILALNCVFRFWPSAWRRESASSTRSTSRSRRHPGSRRRLLTTFFRIVLPIMFPAFVAGFIYTFMTAIVS